MILHIQNVSNILFFSLLLRKHTGTMTKEQKRQHKVLHFLAHIYDSVIVCYVITLHLSSVLLVSYLNFSMSVHVLASLDDSKNNSRDLEFISYDMMNQIMLLQWASHKSYLQSYKTLIEINFGRHDHEPSCENYSLAYIVCVIKQCDNFIYLRNNPTTSHLIASLHILAVCVMFVYTLYFDLRCRLKMTA